jgi:hypothetical protein
MRIGDSRGGRGVGMKIAEFFAQRKLGENQFFECPAGHPKRKGRTVLVTSHIYWTDLIGLSLLRMGYDVLFAAPWYLFWTSDALWGNFDALFAEWVNIIKQHKVACIVGGNTTAMVIHPKTGEPLHRAAGVPVVHYWWDEPRTSPPMSQRGISLRQYVGLIKDERTLNVVWDADVREELERYLGVTNAVHVPLGTTPDLWYQRQVPLKMRTRGACFLGNCHWFGEERAGYDPELVQWAERVTAAKLGDLTKSVVECIGGETAIEPVDAGDEAALQRDFQRWWVLDVVLMDQNRVDVVKSLAARLGKDFTLVGKKWQNVGLTAHGEHSGVPGANLYYATHKASLNLFGGCVHGGMPLRPYDIASANGLIFTHYNRELPDLFEPGKECIAFKNESEMNEQLDRVLGAPQEYDRVVEAGHRRMVAEHTWEHRMARVMGEVGERFGVAA